jgi:uncharacterized protein (DUF1800 family)
MVADAKSEALFALHRFGFGPRAGSAATISADPRGALLADIERPGAAALTVNMLSSGEAARAALEAREARRAARLAREATKTANPSATLPDAGAMPNRPGTPPLPGAARTPNPPRANANPAAVALQQVYRDEAKARTEAALNAEIGFAERLTWFWSNHFCVSVAKNGVRPLAGAYEREAIRPHVLGRFHDMLLAVETHPAMLIYLDNARSIGPNSQAGVSRGRGLNENLAREVLELHTLGVRTVYTQDDVTRFAKIITGWTVVPARQEHAGEFVFNPRMHEPGAQTLIGAQMDESAPLGFDGSGPGEAFR